MAPKEKKSRAGCRGKWEEVAARLDEITEWIGEGKTEKQVYDNLGISADTFYTYKRERPEFSDALKKGKRKKIQNVVGALYKRAVGFVYDETKVIVDDGGKKRVEKVTKTMAPDVGACAFMLKNLDFEHWKDVHQMEHTGKDGGPIETNTNVRDAFTSRITRLAERQTAESLN